MIGADGKKISKSQLKKQAKQEEQAKRKAERLKKVEEEKVRPRQATSTQGAGWHMRAPTYHFTAVCCSLIVQTASSSAKLEEAKAKELKEDPSLPTAKRVSAAQQTLHAPAHTIAAVHSAQPSYLRCCTGRSRSVEFALISGSA